VTGDSSEIQAPTARLDEPFAGSEHPGERGRLRRIAIDIRPLRQAPAFRRLWLGQAISFIGGEITYVAMPFQMYALTGSTLAVGMLSLCLLVPLLTLTLVGGAIADAVDRRRLLLWTEAGLSLASAGLAVNAALPHPRAWLLYIFAVVSASFFCLGVPAMRSLTPRLVPQEQIAAASNLESLYGNFGAVAGPALAGVLIAAVGLSATYLIDVASFGASLASVWALPAISPAADADRPSARSIAEGFRYVRTQPAVLGIFLVDTNAMIFGMPSALFPALAEHRFGGGAQTVGLLYAAPYGGALAASLLSGWVSHARRHGVIVVIAAGLWGAAIAVFGFVTSLALALAFLALAGAADLVSAVFRSAIVLKVTPDALRGRVSGIEFAQVASAPTLGNVEAGVLASLTSIRFSVVSGGLACVVGTCLIALLLPALRRYDARA
jgi:MFS family permease